MSVTPSQLLSELPAPIQHVVFGTEVPRMDTEAGRRVCAAWRQAGADLERLARRIDAENMALPDAVRDDLGDRIAAGGRSLRTNAAGAGEYCRGMERHIDRSMADTDKEAYTMYAFGLMTVYQLLVAGGWHPIRAMQVLSEARAEHLARFAAFVAERAGAGAAAAAERAGLLIAQAGGFAALTAGVDAGVQIGQILGILDGHRDSVDWSSVAISAAAGAGAGLGGALGGHVARAVVPRGAPVLLGQAVIAATAGLSGVIGGATAAAAMTGEFHLPMSALVSGAALGVAAAHAHTRAHPNMDAPTIETGGVREVFGAEGIDRIVRPGERGAQERLGAVDRDSPSTAEPVTPVEERSGLGAGDQAATAAQRSGHPGVVESTRQTHGDAGQHLRDNNERGNSAPTSGQSAEPAAGPRRGDTAATAQPETVSSNHVARVDAGRAGDPEQALFRRLNELREQELAETRAGSGGAVAGAAPVSESGHAGATSGSHPGGADGPGRSTGTGVPGGADGPGGPAHAGHGAAEGDAVVPSTDSADLPQRVTLRDEARAQLAQELGVSPQEIRFWGHEAFDRAVGEVEAWLGRLGETGWAQMDPAVRTGVLTDLGPRLVKRARAIAAEIGESAPLQQWLRQVGLGGERAEVPGTGRWAAVRRAADAEGMPSAGRLLDRLERYGAADARVRGLDQRAADGTSNPDHAKYRIDEPAAVVDAGDSASAGAGRAEVTASSDSRPRQGTAEARIESTQPQRTAADAESSVVPAQDKGSPSAENRQSSVENAVRDRAAALVGEVAARARASDFTLLQRGSARARSELAAWLGLSNTECFTMTPSQLRTAVEFWVERAERSPQWGEESGSHAGRIIGDEVRRVMAAGAVDGRPVVDEVRPAQAVPGALLRRLHDWAGADAAVVERWMDVHALSDRLLAGQHQVLGPEVRQRLQTDLAAAHQVEGTAVYAAPESVSADSPVSSAERERRDAAARRAYALWERELALTKEAHKNGAVTMSVTAADMLVAAGLSRPVEPAYTHSSGSGSKPGFPDAGRSRPESGVGQGRSASGAGQGRPDTGMGRGRPEPETGQGRSENDGTGAYSAPRPTADRPSETGRGAVAVAEREHAAAAPADHVREAAWQRYRELRERELAETEQAARDVPDASPRPDLTEAERPSATRVPDAGTEAPADAATSPKTAVAENPTAPHGEPTAPHGEPAAAHREPAAAHREPTAPHREPAAAQPEPATAQLPPAALAAVSAASPGDDNAPDADEAQSPQVPALSAAEHTAESAESVETPSTAEDVPDPRRLAHEHTAATAELAALLQVSPQELRSWGRQLLEQVIDRFERWSSGLGEAGWARLDPSVRAGLLTNLGEMFGRQMRDLARTHRESEAVMAWLRDIGLGPDGSVSGERLAELRRAAATAGYAPPGLIDALERYLASAARLAAMPPIPGDADQRPPEDAPPDATQPVATTTNTRPRQTFGESWWSTSPWRPEWIRLGLARGELSGTDKNWLHRLVRMGPGELSRRWQELQAIPTRRVRPPGISSHPRTQVWAPRVDSAPARSTSTAHRRTGPVTRVSAPVALYRLPVGLWRPPEPGSVGWQMTPRSAGLRRPLAPVAGAGLVSYGGAVHSAPDMPHAPTPIDCAARTGWYLVEENGNIMVARNLAANPLTPDPGLGGVDPEPLTDVLGGGEWEDPGTWQALADRLATMAPGAAAYVVIEHRSAPAGFGVGHALLVFNDRAQPGVIKVRDPLVAGGAKRLFDARRMPQNVNIFVKFYRAPEAEASAEHDRAGNATVALAVRAVAGVEDDGGPVRLSQAVRPGLGPLRSEHFPLPGRKMTTNDPDRNATLRVFSLWQAQVANQGLGKLVSRWNSADTSARHRRIVAQVYFWLSHQRYLRQVRAVERDPSLVGAEGESHPDHFRTRLGDDIRNIDAFGHLARLRAGVRRDPQTGAWHGGVGTQAFWTVRAIGRRIRTRMAHEAPNSDVLQNVVELPDGSSVNGNVLHSLGHDRFVSETALADDQRTIFAAAVAEFATLLEHRSSVLSVDPLRQFANAVYLLFQAPLMSRGSDATIRMFAATAFTFAFGRPVRLPHDIDVQAMARQQSDFVGWLAEALDRRFHADRHVDAVRSCLPARGAVAAERESTKAELAAALSRNHGVELSGFEEPEIGLAATLEVVRAVRESSLPHTILGIGVHHYPDADMFLIPQLEIERGRFGTQVYLSRRYLADPELLGERWRQHIEASKRRVRIPDRPIRHMVVEGIGHAMVHAGRWRAELYAPDVLRALYEKNVRHGRNSYATWLQEQFGAYCCAGEDIDVRKALVESFIAVELAAESATEGEKALYELLLAMAQTWADDAEPDRTHPLTESEQRRQWPRTVGGLLLARELGIAVRGHKMPDVDGATMRIFTETVRATMREHPQIRLGEIGVQALDDGTLGYSYPDHLNDPTATAWIRLNERYAINPALFRRDLARSISEGFNRGIEDDPVRSTVLHELGHALVYAGRYYAESMTEEVLREHYLATRGSLDGYDEWYDNQFSGYCYRQLPGGELLLKSEEALPESFVTMKLYPEKATEGERLLYALLIRAAEVVSIFDDELAVGRVTPAVRSEVRALIKFVLADSEPSGGVAGLPHRGAPAVDCYVKALQRVRAATGSTAIGDLAPGQIGARGTFALAAQRASGGVFTAVAGWGLLERRLLTMEPGSTFLVIYQPEGAGSRPIGLGDSGSGSHTVTIAHSREHPGRIELFDPDGDQVWVYEPGMRPVQLELPEEVDKVAVLYRHDGRPVPLAGPPMLPAFPVAGPPEPKAKLPLVPPPPDRAALDAARSALARELRERFGDRGPTAMELEEFSMEPLSRMQQYAHTDMNIDRLASTLGMPSGQLRAYMRAELRNLVAGKPVAIRIDSDSLLSVLDDGVYRSSHGSDEGRAQFEQLWFGHAPVYGYIAIDGIRPAGLPGLDAMSDDYGPEQIVLKARVRADTTFTVGDFEVHKTRTIASPLTDPLEWSYGVASDPKHENRGLVGINRNYDGQPFRGSIYVEAQIHRDVTVDDIDYVVLHREPHPALRAALDRRGVAWRVLNNRTIAERGSAAERMAAIARVEDDLATLRGGYSYASTDPFIRQRNVEREEQLRTDLARLERGLAAGADVAQVRVAASPLPPIEAPPALPWPPVGGRSDQSDGAGNVAAGATVEIFDGSSNWRPPSKGERADGGVDCFERGLERVRRMTGSTVIGALATGELGARGAFPLAAQRATGGVFRAVGEWSELERRLLTMEPGATVLLVRQWFDPATHRLSVSGVGPGSHTVTLSHSKERPGALEFWESADDQVWVYEPGHRPSLVDLVGDRGKIAVLYDHRGAVQPLPGRPMLPVFPLAGRADDAPIAGLGEHLVRMRAAAVADLARLRDSGVGARSEDDAAVQGRLRGRIDRIDAVATELGAARIEHRRASIQLTARIVECPDFDEKVVRPGSAELRGVPGLRNAARAELQQLLRRDGPSELISDADIASMSNSAAATEVAEHLRRLDGVIAAAEKFDYDARRLAERTERAERLEQLARRVHTTQSALDGLRARIAAHPHAERYHVVPGSERVGRAELRRLHRTRAALAHLLGYEDDERVTGRQAQQYLAAIGESGEPIVGDRRRRSVQQRYDGLRELIGLVDALETKHGELQSHQRSLDRFLRGAVRQLVGFDRALRSDGLDRIWRAADRRRRELQDVLIEEFGQSRADVEQLLHKGSPVRQARQAEFDQARRAFEQLLDIAPERLATYDRLRMTLEDLSSRYSREGWPDEVRSPFLRLGRAYNVLAVVDDMDRLYRRARSIEALDAAFRDLGSWRELLSSEDGRRADVDRVYHRLAALVQRCDTIARDLAEVSVAGQARHEAIAAKHDLQLWRLRPGWDEQAKLDLLIALARHHLRTTLAGDQTTLPPAELEQLVRRATAAPRQESREWTPAPLEDSDVRGASVREFMELDDLATYAETAQRRRELLAELDNSLEVAGRELVVVSAGLDDYRDVERTATLGRDLAELRGNAIAECEAATRNIALRGQSVDVVSVWQAGPGTPGEARLHTARNRIRQELGDLWSVDAESVTEEAERRMLAATGRLDGLDAIKRLRAVEAVITNVRRFHRYDAWIRAIEALDKALSDIRWGTAVAEVRVADLRRAHLEQHPQDAAVVRLGPGAADRVRAALPGAAGERRRTLRELAAAMAVHDEAASRAGELAGQCRELDTLAADRAARPSAQREAIDARLDRMLGEVAAEITIRAAGATALDGSVVPRSGADGYVGHAVGYLPRICLPVAFDAASAGAGPRPQLKVPPERLVEIAVAGVDGVDAALWAGAKWHPGGLPNMTAGIDHVRHSGGTGLLVADWGPLGAHMVTVKFDDEGVLTVVELVPKRDAGGAVLVGDDGMVETEISVVSGDSEVDAWAAELTARAGDATHHALMFDAKGAPEHSITPAELRLPTAEWVGERGRDLPAGRIGVLPPEPELPLAEDGREIISPAGELAVAIPPPDVYEEVHEWLRELWPHLGLEPRQVDEIIGATTGTWLEIDAGRELTIGEMRAVLRRIPMVKHLYSTVAQQFFPDLETVPDMVGPSLRRIRDHTGLRNEQFAVAADVLSITVSKREGARRLPPARQAWETHLRTLAAHLARPVDGDMPIGVCLRAFREIWAVTPAQLARKMGVLPDAIADIESGTSQLPKETVEAYLIALVPGVPRYPEGYPHVGSYLRFLREAAGAKAAQVAAATGITEAAVRNREQGRVAPSKELVDFYLREYSDGTVSFDELAEMFVELQVAAMPRQPDSPRPPFTYPDVSGTRSLPEYMRLFEQTNGTTRYETDRLFGYNRSRQDQSQPVTALTALKVYDLLLFEVAPWNTFAEAWGYAYRMVPTGERPPAAAEFDSVYEWIDATRHYRRLTWRGFENSAGWSTSGSAFTHRRRGTLKYLHKMRSAGHISDEELQAAVNRFQVGVDGPALQAMSSSASEMAGATGTALPVRDLTDPHRPLRAVTWNIAGGRRSLSNEEFDYQADLDYFAEQLDVDADVVLLQEVEIDGADSTAQTLADRCGYPFVYVTEMCPSHLDPTKKLGLAVLSRIPMTHTRSVQLPETGLALHEKGWRKPEFDRHLQIVELAGGLVVKNIHPTPIRRFHPAPGATDGAYTFEAGPGAVHAEAIAATIRAAAPGTKDIFGGDINTPRPHAVYGERTFDALGYGDTLEPETRTVPGEDSAQITLLASLGAFRVAGAGVVQTATDRWLRWADLEVADAEARGAMAAARRSEELSAGVPGQAPEGSAASNVAGQRSQMSPDRSRPQRTPWSGAATGTGSKPASSTPWSEAPSNAPQRPGPDMGTPRRSLLLLPDDVHFRYLAGEQLYELHDPLLELNKDFNDRPPSLGKLWIDHWADSERLVGMAVAELGGPGGRLVGFCLGLRYRTPNEGTTYVEPTGAAAAKKSRSVKLGFDEPNVHITAVMVDRDFRGYRIADAMLYMFLDNRSESTFSLHVAAANETAAAVYERVGRSAFIPHGLRLGSDFVLYRGRWSTVEQAAVREGLHAAGFGGSAHDLVLRRSRSTSESRGTEQLDARQQESRIASGRAAGSFAYRQWIRERNSSSEHSHTERGKAGGEPAPSGHSHSGVQEQSESLPTEAADDRAESGGDVAPGGAPIEVRQLTPDDWELERDITLQVLADAPESSKTTLAEAQARPEQRWREIVASRLAVLAAMRGDIRIGGVDIHVVPGQPDTVELKRIFVVPRERGAGASDLLLHTAMAWAREHGFGRIARFQRADNVHAERLYARNGFHQVSHEPGYYEDGVARIEMARTLRGEPEVRPGFGI